HITSPSHRVIRERRNASGGVPSAGASLPSATRMKKVAAAAMAVRNRARKSFRSRIVHPWLCGKTELIDARINCYARDDGTVASARKLKIYCATGPCAV